MEIKSLKFFVMALAALSYMTSCDDDDDESGWKDTAKYVQPEAVDMGVSVKWANCNVGATKPSEPGAFFAWGETEPRDSTTYVWSKYKYGTEDALTKYNETDGLTELQPEDDAATVKLGSHWRTPTYAEVLELTNACEVEYMSDYEGVPAYKLTSKTTGNVIYFTLCGYYGNYWGEKGTVSHLYYYGIKGCYWASTLDADMSQSLDLFFNGNTHYTGQDKALDMWYRCGGQPIRPVYVD